MLEDTNSLDGAHLKLFPFISTMKNMLGQYNVIAVYPFKWNDFVAMEPCFYGNSSIL